MPTELPKQAPTELQCRAWLVHNEARGEPVKGRKAVLDVLETRMKAKDKTACEIIAEPKQFEGYDPLAPFFVDSKALTNLEEADKMPSIVRGCKYFHAKYVRPSWADKMIVCKRVGGHTFYKEKKK